MESKKPLTSSFIFYLPIEPKNHLLKNKTILYILDQKIELQIKKQANIHINTVITRNDLLEGDF